MAHSLSAKKRIRQNTKRRLLNRGRRSALRTRLHKCADGFVHGTPQQVEQEVLAACQQLDREADRGTLHRNAAARRKSRLMKRLNALKQKTAAQPTPPAPAGS